MRPTGSQSAEHMHEASRAASSNGASAATGGASGAPESRECPALGMDRFFSLLKQNKYYGTVTVTLREGDITLIQENQTHKSVEQAIISHKPSG